MRRYAVRRLLLGCVQVIAVAALACLLVEALPGDAAVALAGDNPDPAVIELIRAQMRLDEPVAVRFALWLAALAAGDLGESLISARPVTEILLGALEPTLTLAVLSLAVLLPLSVLLGVVAALREGGLLDRAITSVGVGFYAVPEFALAVVLVALFGVRLGWLPPTAVGVPSLIAEPTVLALPMLVLLARPVCSISRLVRAEMIEALASEYVEHARRIGLSERAVVLRHALPNALAPAVAQMSRTTDWLLGGVVVVEAVFVIPGLGTVLVDAVSARDLPVVQGLAVVFATTTVLVNLCADLIALRLAPAKEVTR